ncbi:hypothetical protein F2P79_002575 [Pimephales promelas]|nr:hypothetical protein F2P79_002575 [Pimephales promelas]
MTDPLKVLSFIFWLFSFYNEQDQGKLTLTLKPPIVRELFVNNKVVLEAVVSGALNWTVQEASVLCKVKNTPVSSETGNIHFSQDISQFTRIHKITVDSKAWFDGEMVTCSLHDTNNNRDIRKEIHFDKGDGQKPSVVIYRPDSSINADTVSLVCEVTGSKLGDVNIMWKVGEEPYIVGSTSAHIHQKNSMSVLSLLTVSKQEYDDLQTPFTCAVKHANTDYIGSPLEVTMTKMLLSCCCLLRP